MNLYQEEILEHYHNPRNGGVVKNATHEHCTNNPTCGDKICVTAILNDDIIKDIKFSGDGCAISQAAASMVTESINGGTVKDALALRKDDVIEMLGIEIGIGRIRCAMLGIETIQKALEFGEIKE